MKQLVNVYCSAPISDSRLACAFLSLTRQGVQLVERPLSELGLPAPRRELLQVSQRLAAIGEQLSAHEAGQVLLDAGSENGLRAERDALQSRQRALQATRRASTSSSSPS
jgi:hypothetical protein